MAERWKKRKVKRRGKEEENGRKRAGEVKRKPSAPLCLVTGACGFCGSHMVDLLLERGFRVRATDTPAASKEFLNPEAEFVPADMTKSETLKGVCNGVDILFHSAALFSYSAPFDALMKVNVEGTHELFEEAVRAGVKKVVMWSTAGVYDTSDVKFDGEPVNETWPLAPYNPYEESKIEQEKVALKFIRLGKLDVTVIRPTPIYGPRNLYGVANIIFGLSMLHAVPIPSTLKGYSTAVHVRDVAGAALHLALKEGTDGEFFNVCDDSNLTYAELLTLIASLMGKPPLPILIPISKSILAWLGILTAKLIALVRKKYPDLPPIIEEDTVNYVKYIYKFSNSKLKATGYKLLYPDTRIGIIETYKWYKDNGYI